MAITRPRSLDPTQSFSANALTANTITATTFAGSGASITINGTAIALGGSGSITAGATITDDTTTATTHYPVLTISTSGAMLVANTSSSKLTYIPSTGVLSATSFTGAGTGLTGTAASLSIGGNAAGLSTALVIASGGTNSTATPTAGGAVYGTGTAYAITAAGTAGQVLTSAGAGVPTWSSAVFISGTKLGVGTNTPSNPLHVVSGALNTDGDSQSSQYFQVTGPNTAGDVSNAMVVIATNDTLGADIGGSLGFGARYSGTSQFTCATISGRKNNATAGEFGGYMAFGTRAHGQSISEKMRLTSQGGLSLGTTAVGSAGALLVTGAITAMYSDSRLKENIKPITNALDKVDSLTGMLFTQNALAESFGYTDKSQQVGVFAQDIQAVLPEAVKLAPFDMDEDGNSKSGENYLTVQYEKLVPLLIEAIKELRLEVKALKGL